jgi:pilus assembly protein CpaE
MDGRSEAAERVGVAKRKRLVKVEACNTGPSGMCVITMGADPASAAVVRQATLREGGRFAGELKGYSFSEGEVEALLKLENAEASVCVIDFDQDHERAVAAAATLQQVLHRKATLIALSERSEPALILDAMRAGCSEYLSKPLSIEALCESLTRLRGRLKAILPARSTEGKTLAFLGCRGGAGATTLAVHLAMFLCRPYGRKTLLVDQHGQLGHVALHLGLDGASYDFNELVRNVGRLDRTFLNGFVSHHGSGLDILPSASLISGSPEASPDALARVLHFLAEEYEYVVLDLPRGLGELNLVTVDGCGELYLVATPDVPALRDLSRFLDRLLECAVSPAKIRIVVNRFSSQEAVSREQIERAIGRPISITVPNHSTALIRAINTGTPLAADDRSEFAEQMRRWAGSLAPSEAVVLKPKRRFALWG